MLTVENFTSSKIIKAITDFSHKDKVIFAVYCAELVIDIYENKSDSKAPRLAIEAAKEWIKNPTEENKQKCRSAYTEAAYAATAATTAAAYAAYAAAHAVHADDAVYAAATAAAATAADAAVAAADAAATADSAAHIAYAVSAYAATVKTKIVNKINEMK